MSKTQEISQVVTDAINRAPTSKLGEILELRVQALDYVKRRDYDSVNRIIKRIERIR